MSRKNRLLLGTATPGIGHNAPPTGIADDLLGQVAFDALLVADLIAEADERAAGHIEGADSDGWVILIAITIATFNARNGQRHEVISMLPEGLAKALNKSGRSVKPQHFTNSLRALAGKSNSKQQLRSRIKRNAEYVLEEEFANEDALKKKLKAFGSIGAIEEARKVAGAEEKEALEEYAAEDDKTALSPELLREAKLRILLAEGSNGKYETSGAFYGYILWPSDVGIALVSKQASGTSGGDLLAMIVGEAGSDADDLLLSCVDHWMSKRGVSSDMVVNKAVQLRAQRTAAQKVRDRVETEKHAVIEAEYYEYVKQREGADEGEGDSEQEGEQEKEDELGGEADPGIEEQEGDDHAA